MESQLSPAVIVGQTNFQNLILNHNNIPTINGMECGPILQEELLEETSENSEE